MSEKLTPLLAQYRRIKERYPETLLLFRVGDFYEMFYEDAEVGARVLNLTLTSRTHGPNHRVPLAGIPVKSLDNYVAKLVTQGLRVAICEQLEPPCKAKPIVQRDVVEVITPGTLIRDTLLDQRRNNYLMGISPAGDILGMAFVDLSTGEFALSEIHRDNLEEEIAKITPAEILLPQNWNGQLSLDYGVRVTRLDDYYFTHEFAFEKLTTHFGVINLGGFGVEHLTEGICAAGAVLEYLEQTQCSTLPHLRRLKQYQPSEYLLIDRISRKNLELTESLHPENQRRSEIGTLFGVINKTVTPPGTRLLRRLLITPLISVEKINERQAAVGELVKNSSILLEIQEKLSHIGDLERVAARIALERATARDLIALRNWLMVVPDIKEYLNRFSAKLLMQISEKIPDLTSIVTDISQTLIDNPPLAITEGGMIKKGYAPELDSLRELANNAKDLIARIQERERHRTGIPNLRVGYNSVFGYYIEITRSYLRLVPPDYIRKQTIANGERFVTPELKEYENKILHAEERIKTLEYEIFLGLRNRVKAETAKILDLANAMAELDVLVSFAVVARERNYVCPVVDNSPIIDIKAGRHPVVEAMSNEPFIPNDTFIDNSKQQILIITGPNMAGKSTYLRQVALLVIMAQIGSFIPAQSARIGVVDKIFTRIGASDDVARGVSTFLAEMIETANILNNLTSRSLVILDEVGRGTSTHDGLAIAWATVEYLHDNETLRPRTLFATHYHELTEIATLLPRVKNFSFIVKEKGEKILFLRKIRPGPADKSYGIAVAKLAGLPTEVINRAKEIMQRFTKNEKTKIIHLNQQLQSTLSGDHNPIHPVVERLRNLNINDITPLQAINLLAQLTRIAQQE